LIPYIGDFVANSTVRYFFGTNASTGASVNRTTAGAIRVYKGTSVTERTSVVGITDTSGFDSVTGLNSLSIDLSNNTDAGFYAVGNDYVVVLVGAVIDTQTVNVPLFQFSIENRFSSISNAVWNTLESSITTASSIGLKVKTNLNDTITSRMATFTYTAPPSTADIWNTNVSGYTTAGQAGTYQKNLDALITSRMATFTYTAPPTTTEIWSAATRTLTANPGITAQNVWEYATRTLTSGAAPSTVDIWTYGTRTLTSGAAPSATTIADAVLNRKLDSTGDGTDTLNERTVRSALRAMRNKVVVASGVMTVSKEDDTTTAWTGSLSNTADVTVDPV
jgi:hypothetical protein